MRIMRIGPDDWQLSRDLRLAMLADSPESFGRETLAQAHTHDDQYWRVYHARHLRPQAVKLVALAPQPVGTMRCELDGRTAGLHGVWVHPEHRGRGIADALADAVIDWARSQGARRLTLEVTDSAAAARAFYRRRGFVETGETTALEKYPGRYELTMTLDLTHSPG